MSRDSQLPLQIWASALFVSFGLFVLLLLLSIPSIFLVILILILALGSAILTRVFISGSPENRTNLEKWLFVFVSSFFINLICLLVEGDLGIIVPLMLIYGFALFMFNSIRSFILYFVLGSVVLTFQLYWLGGDLISITTVSVWGYLAIFFSMVLFLFLYNHDFQVKNKAFHLLSDQLGRYYEQEKQKGNDVCVIHTNKDLEITSVSRVAQQLLFSYQTNVIGKKLFSVLYLKDESGSLIGTNSQLLSDFVSKLEQVTLDRLTLILPNTAKQYQTSLSVHPVITIDGDLAHVEFIIQSPELKGIASSPSFESQRMALNSMLNSLKRQIGLGNKENSIFTTELLDKGFSHLKVFEDLQTGLIPHVGLVDSAQLTRGFVQASIPFVGQFKNQLVLTVMKKQDQIEDNLFPDTMKDAVHELTGPYYTIKTDQGLFLQVLDVLTYCLLVVSAYEQDKKIGILVDSNDKEVSISFELQTDVDAQITFKKLFESDGRILDADEVGYTLGIEPALLLQLLGLLKGSMHYEVGAKTNVRLVFERYVSKNIRKV